ncbi:MAG: hypothetical protein ACLFVG_06985 [Candidatus Aminicenantes bacterium]
MFIERLKLRREIDNILTTEQREAMKDMWKDRWRGKRELHRWDRFEQSPRLKERIR